MTRPSPQELTQALRNLAPFTLDDVRCKVEDGMPIAYGQCVQTDANYTLYFDQRGAFGLGSGYVLSRNDRGHQKLTFLPTIAAGERAILRAL